MSNTILPTEIKIGDYIEYSLISNPVMIYSGKVTGITSYSVARCMGRDIAAINEEIKETNSNILDVTDQSFIIVDTGDTISQVVGFEWLVNGCVKRVERGATYTIRLINCSKDAANNAISLLRSYGISCKLNTEY